MAVFDRCLRCVCLLLLPYLLFTCSCLDVEARSCDLDTSRSELSTQQSLARSLQLCSTSTPLNTNSLCKCTLTSSSNQISPNVVDPDERSNFHPVHLSLFTGSEPNYPDSHDLLVTLLVAFAQTSRVFLNAVHVFSSIFYENVWCRGLSLLTWFFNYCRDKLGSHVLMCDRVTQAPVLFFFSLKPANLLLLLLFLTQVSKFFLVFSTSLDHIIAQLLHCVCTWPLVLFFTCKIL